MVLLFVNDGMLVLLYLLFFMFFFISIRSEKFKNVVLLRWRDPNFFLVVAKKFCKFDLRL